MRGGGGVRLKYSNPMHLDDVAADFPDMPIDHGPPVGALAGRGAVGRPAQAERVHRPVRLVAEVLPAAARALREHAAQDKVLFGTDFPALTPERWLRDFDTLDIKPEVRPLILKDNARRLLGL